MLLAQSRIETRRRRLDTSSIPLPKDNSNSDDGALALRTQIANMRIFRAYRRVVSFPQSEEPSSEFRRVRLQLAPEKNGMDPLLGWVLASICIVFFVTRLDALTNDASVRTFIISLLNWGSCCRPIFPNHFWTPITCMWFHSSFFHLASNLSSIALFALWLNRAFGPKWWRLFFFLGGALAAVGHVYLVPIPPADFAHWHGRTLVSLFSEPDTPLAGASGGAFAMYGAAIAASLRYWLARKTGVKNKVGYGFLELLAYALLQFVFFDSANPGVAGAAHQMGLVAGFLMGLLPPISGAVFLLCSRIENLSIASVEINLNNEPLWAEVLLKPGFDQSKDFIVKVHEQIGLWKKTTMWKKVGGHIPAGARLTPIPIKLQEVQLGLGERLKLLLLMAN